MSQNMFFCLSFLNFHFGPHLSPVPNWGGRNGGRYPKVIHLSVRSFVHYIFRFPCIFWQTIWNEWHKIRYAEVSWWLTLGRHRCRCVLLSFHASVRPSICPSARVLVLLTNLLEEKVYIVACWCIQMTYPQCIDAYWYSCPSIRSFIKFSVFGVFADKSLGRNSITFAIRMHPDDSPSADIDAEGYHFIPYVCPSVRPSALLFMSLGFGIANKSFWRKKIYIWHADVSRWLTLSLSTRMRLTVRPSICSPHFQVAVH